MSEAMVATARELLVPVVEALAGPGEPIRKLAAAVHLLTSILGRHRGELLAYVDTLAAAPRNASVAAALQDLHREFAAVVAAEIETQQRRGELPGWVDPDAMARVIVATVHGTLVAAAIDPDATDAGAIATQFAGLLLAARVAPDA